MLFVHVHRCVTRVCVFSAGGCAPNLKAVCLKSTLKARTNSECVSCGKWRFYTRD